MEAQCYKLWATESDERASEAMGTACRLDKAISHQLIGGTYGFGSNNKPAASESLGLCKGIGNLLRQTKGRGLPNFVGGALDHCGLHCKQRKTRKRQGGGTVFKNMVS